MRVNGVLSFLSFCDVCSAACRSNCSVGAMMARFDHRDRIATFFEELAHLYSLSTCIQGTCT